ncbi:MAG TPA: T9SS type A sorting domain-containing protein [Bacteroidia bacterium]|jgi:hypothetical protein
MKIKLPKTNLRKKIPPLNPPFNKGITALLIFFALQTGMRAQITSGFELEGNATSVLPNPPDDWDMIYNNTSNAQITTNVVTDMNNIFQGGGSKDDLDINNWGWTTGSVPDKDDILHGGVALYDNCKLYFFADRYATNGSSNIGFWLFKNNVSVSAGGSFTGVHTVGDLLIVSEFVNGGGTAVIKAYVWVGSGGDVNGTLDSVPVTGINSFAITNTTAVPSPWPFVPKTGAANIFGPGAFFEGGIDLCSIPGLDPCFTSFLIETRASFSIDAVLKDFLNGSFNTSPQISLTGCSRCINGPAVTLTANVTGGLLPLGYSWSPGGSTSSSITVSPTMTTTYTVTVTGSNGCAETATATVTVNSVPNVNAGADKTLNCTTSSVMLSGSSSTAGVNFSWTTIGGNIVSGASTAMPTVDAQGTYILTVSSTAGCSAKDTTMVTFTGITPDANAGPDDTLTCAMTQTNLNGSSTTPGATFAWIAINGGAILSGANTATPLVQIPGTYVLTVTEPVSGCTANDSANVYYDNTIPDVDAGGDMVLNCVVSSTILDGSSSTPGAMTMWTSFSGGNIVSGGATFNPVANTAGGYVLTITHPTSGCSAKDTAMITSNMMAPNVNAGADTAIGCGISTVILNGSSTSNVGFNWTTLGGNIVSGANTATPIVNAPGTYILKVIDHINGCCAYDTVVIYLGIPPTVDLGNDTTLIFCQGYFTLDAGNPGMDYLWSTMATTQTITVTTSGTYWVKVTNGSGCTATDTINVTINPGTLTVDLGNDTTFMNCHALPFILDAGISGATYLWSTTETTQTIVVTTSGMYYVTVTDSIGCMDSDTINVNIINNNIEVDLGADTTVCSCIVLNAGNPGATYTWCGGETYAMINVCISGTYCVTVSNGTCTDSDTINIIVNPPPVVNLGNDTTLTSGSLVLNAGNTGANFMWSTGATTQTITVTTSGQYYVTVTDTFGCSASDTINVTITSGIGENITDGFSQIAYPNPSSTNAFTLSFSVTEKTDAEIKVMNVLGEVVYSEKLENFSGPYKKVITLKNATSGIYFIDVLNKTGRSTAKLIVE